MRYTKSMVQEEIKGDTTLYTLKITGLFGGHSGVGQGITAITTHTFYVAEGAVAAFKAAFGL